MEGGVVNIRKPVLFTLLVLSGLVAGILLSNVLFTLTGISLFGGFSKKYSSTSDTGNADLTTLAYSVLEYIRDDDYTALSGVVHPEFGVVFSPCATINLSTDRRFSADQIAVIDTDDKTYVWGVYNGSGEPIEMKPTDYFVEFVAAGSFANAPVIGINQIVRSGNALENITDIFPDVEFIDFHLPGGERETADEPDWSSLRLGFEEFDGSLRLILILHSKWTV